MVKRILFLLVISVFTILNTLTVHASHFIGGNISYRYIKSEFNGQYHRYAIKITLYRDCSNTQGPGQPPTPFDPTIDIGFYENVPGSKPLKNALTIGPAKETNVQSPSGGATCKLSTNICIVEGIYEGEVSLPASVYGYHVTYARCCRNNLVNMPTFEGTTYYAFIPPTNIINNSISFNDVPAPYICADKQTTILNSATDADGDSLVYSFATPYTGGTQQNPVVTLPSFYTTPDTVNYNFGYSSKYPFGVSGLAKINPATGHTTLLSKKVGKFALAYDIYEYRKGKLIGKVRRDIQIIVRGDCTNNDDPIPQTPGTANNTDTIQTKYTVTAGELLKFDIEVDNKDTVYMSGSGDILNPNSLVPKPIASLPNTGGSAKFITTFIWDTDCIHARPQPYYFNLQLTDKGCPPATTNTLFTIWVVPFKGVDKITGPATICQNVEATYSVSGGKAGSTFAWKTEGGTIFSTDQTTNTIDIKWGKGLDGKVKVVEISKDGCPGDTVILNIQLLPSPVTPQIAGSRNVCVKKTNNYSLASSSSGSLYFWSIIGGKQIQGGNTDKIEVAWDPAGDTAYVNVVEKNASGCFGDTVTILVLKSLPKVDKIFGALSVCPNSKGIDYWVDSKFLDAGSTFKWVAEGGKVNFGPKTDAITIDWGNKGLGKVKVLEFTKYGCIGDTIILDVLIDYNLITPPIIGDTSLCEFTKAESYSVQKTNNSSYSWQISGGTIVSGNGTHSVVVDWNSAGKGVLTVTETAHDSINNLPCIGKPVNLFITINPTPNPITIQGPAAICEKDSAVYNVSGFPGSKFIWSVSENAKVLRNDSSGQFVVYYPIHGIYYISVYELSKDSCAGVEKTMGITVNPLPTTTEISGNKKVCAPNLNGQVYEVMGGQLSSYDWSITGGEIVLGQGESKITVNWKTPGVNTITVREKNIYNCFGALKKLEIQVDSASLIINKVSTLIADDGKIEFGWRLTNNFFFKGHFLIFREIAGSANWKMIDSVPYTQTYYIDNFVNTKDYSYRYRIEAPNICGYNIISVPHRSILLQGYKSNDTTMKIQWNNYEGWPEGVDYYSVYRKNNQDAQYNYFTKVQSGSAEIETGLDNYIQCFRVAASKAADPKMESWSNEFCFIFDPILWVPNIFSPNGDGLNDNFKVFVSFYKSFEIKIFNRWGEQIFYSDSPDKQWDGTYRGKKAEDGVFLYMITVKGMHQSFNKSGTFHLHRY